MLPQDPDVRKELIKIQQALMRKYGLVAAAFGIQGFKQELLSLLMLSPTRPRSITELARLTNYSKASVSRAMRDLLQEVPFLEVVKKPQDRERYYAIRVDFFNMLKGFIQKTIYDEAEPTVRATNDALKKLVALRKAAGDKSLRIEIDGIIQDIELVSGTYEKYLWFMRRIMTYVDRLEREWGSAHPE